MKYSVISKTGDRDINEDSFSCVQNEWGSLFVVADGLGGHGYGEVASSIAVSEMSKAFREAEEGALNAVLDSAILRAQEVLLSEQNRMGTCSEMKTTVVALCCGKDRLCWGHVGDSRLYAFRRNKVKTRTLDHSIPQMLVLSGDIPERKIRKHPQRNMLLRVLGIEWDRPKHEISEEQYSSEFQAFLLCSDGFWELITEWEMCWLLWQSSSVEDWLKKMTAVVEKNGRNKDMDNYTAIAVFC